jgi:hypothetical protein
MLLQDFVRWNRIETNRIQKGWQHSDSCTLTTMICHTFNSPAHWVECSTLLMEVASKSPGFIKCSPRCLNLNLATASQSQRICEAISNACLHLSHPNLSASHSLSKCPFKWQCPVSSPIIILSWFLLKLSNSQALLAQGCLRKPLA